MIDSAPKLQIIVSNTTGLNHIDCEYAASRQIQVLSLRGETDFLRDIRGTAEHTIGLMLSLMRRIPAAYQDVINGRWDRYPFRGSEIFRKTVGIIGYGRLGRIVATYLHAFGAHVLVADSHLGDEIPSHATVAELPGLLGQSDIVTLHASYNPENAGLIGEREFQQMKRGAYFINTARGELVDESALLRALESGHLAGAALDVLSNEHALDLCYHPLRNYAASHDNLLLTPHIGGNTVESGAATELFLARKLIARLPSQTAK